ncbi:MAG TPA: hypothetical protein VHT53_08130 [Candidatus Elarobacter sp.]|nr:hypothetical protein [Candidatus Elarobacter sp.]
MIAPELVAPRATPRELRRIDRARHATRRRARRTRRRLNRPVFVVLSLAVIAMVMMLTYVQLTAAVTATTYRLAQAHRERAALMAESLQNDETIAQLQSPERLAALAARLKMHDPHVYALVRVPEPKAQPKPSGLAFFGTWFTTTER